MLPARRPSIASTPRSELARTADPGGTQLHQWRLDSDCDRRCPVFVVTKRDARATPRKLWLVSRRCIVVESISTPVREGPASARRAVRALYERCPPIVEACRWWTWRGRGRLEPWLLASRSGPMARSAPCGRHAKHLTAHPAVPAPDGNSPHPFPNTGASHDKRARSRPGYRQPAYLAEQRPGRGRLLAVALRGCHVQRQGSPGPQYCLCRSNGGAIVLSTVHVPANWPTSTSLKHREIDRLSLSTWEALWTECASPPVARRASGGRRGLPRG
jgi:hypothetical protein